MSAAAPSITRIITSFFFIGLRFASASIILTELEETRNTT